MKTILLAILVGTSLWAQDTAGVGAITGKVDRTEGQVCVVPLARCAAVDPEGNFRLGELRAGEYEIEYRTKGKPEFRSGKILVRAGLEARIEVQVPRVESLAQQLTVSESVFVTPEEIKNSSYTIERFEIFKAAGAQQDVSRYVQTLPGVGIGTNDFRNDLIVRGGSPLENLFIVDNVEIPNINNFANFAAAGGTTSLLDPDLIRDVNFLTGGYPAAFANRTSSVLQIAQREGSRERFGARLSLGSAGLGAILEGPLKQGKGSWVFSGKRSFVDAFTRDIGLGGVPVNYNFNTKVLYDFTARDRIWLVNIGGVDRIRLGATDKAREPDADRDPELDLIDVRYRGWRSATGLNWQHLYGTNGVGLLGVTQSEARVNQTTKDLFRFGLTASSASALIANSPVLFREDNREGETTIKYDLTLTPAWLGKLQTGASVKLLNLRYSTDQPFGQDNPYSTIPGANPFFFRKSISTSQSSAYLQTTRQMGTRWNLTLGGRFDRYEQLGKGRWSPRAGLSYQLSRRWSLRGSYGLYFQPPQALFVEAFPINRALNPIRSVHLVGGASWLVNPTLRVTIEAYRKDYSNYPVSTQWPSFSLANAGDTFAVTDILLPYVSAGRGRVRGLELFAEKKFAQRWYGQANLALSRTRHAGLDQIFRPGTYDYPRILNAVGGYRLGKSWDLSARFTYLSGKPYTPFNEALSRQQRRGIFDLSRVNALRAPDYARLDLRADRTFLVRGKPLLVFLGVQNAFNRRNIAQASWDRSKGTVRFNRQLGLFPLLGLDWKF